MQVYHIKIQHFRGIEQCQATLKGHVICLIGPCDSTKSTILDAIECVLCPNWFIPLDDSDFTNCEIDKEINIDVTLGPVPDELLSETKYGLHLRGWSAEKHIIHDEPDDQDIAVLTVRLKVDQDLTPDWLVVTDRTPEGVRISYRDRQRFRVVRIGANIDNELSWTRGSALLRLTPDTRSAENILLDANRRLRDITSLNSVDNLNASIGTTKKGVERLGLALPTLRVDIDPRTLRANAATLSLHNDKIPARRLGLGTRRLLAIGAQLQAIEEGAIVLIDEIEHALEPHRIKHLIRTLGTENSSGQVIMTSHSSAALEELGAQPLYVVRSDQLTTSVAPIDTTAQGTVRSIPEAFLSPRVIVCEGPTEVGLLRSYEKHILSDKSQSFALHGVLFVDGGGSNAAKRACDLKEHGYDVCLFADSDTCSQWNPSKDKLIEAEIEIIVWAGACCTEKRVIDDLPNATSLLCFAKAAIETRISEQSILDSINARLTSHKIATLDDIPGYPDYPAITEAICEASISQNNPWFKTTSGGEVLGDFVFSSAFSEMETSDFVKKIKALEAWVLAK